VRVRVLRRPSGEGRRTFGDLHPILRCRGPEPAIRALEWDLLVEVLTALHVPQTGLGACLGQLLLCRRTALRTLVRVPRFADLRSVHRVTDLMGDGVHRPDI